MIDLATLETGILTIRDVLKEGLENGAVEDELADLQSALINEAGMMHRKHAIEEAFQKLGKEMIQAMKFEFPEDDWQNLNKYWDLNLFTQREGGDKLFATISVVQNGNNKPDDELLIVTIEKGNMWIEDTNG